MIVSANEVIICESVSVRIAPGEYFEFAIVDNKDLFPNFFRTTSEFDVEIRCNHINELTYALYKRKANIAYLVCAWEKKEEINDRAMEAIKASPNLHYLLN